MKRRQMPREGNDWEVRNEKADLCVIPWIEKTVPLAGRTVFEYGCGGAPVSCALATRAARVIGIDIEADYLEEGRRRARQAGLENVELIHASPEEILERTEEVARGVDVFVMYAVLEHMTIDERLALLRAARRLVREDGAIVVCELPNRLLPFDAHSTELPFFDQLPGDLALEYFRRSPRRDFVEKIGAALAIGPAEASEVLARWGRGASFHEFELAFDDLNDHVVASNYDELLMPVRAALDEELVVARTMRRYRPDLAPVWSRYWQDVILTPAPATTRAAFIRPLLLDDAEGQGVRRMESGVIEMHHGGALEVTLPAPSRRLLVGVNADVEELAVSVTSGGSTSTGVAPVWGVSANTRYTSVDLPAESAEVELSLSAPGYLVFAGWADPGTAVA